MELEYVAKAVRRFWPVVLLSLLLGVLAGQFLQPSSEARYESSALLLLVPFTGSGLDIAAGDRFVASQLVVLESPPLAVRAAELASLPMPGPEAALAVTFVQIPGTDVVRIVASSGSPGDAQALANGYLDAYVERAEESVGADRDSDPTLLDPALTEIERQLAQLDEQIQAALAPYVEAATAAPIPGIEQIAPALATRREVLVETYRELLGRRSTLEFEPQAEAANQIIQRAGLPTTPIDDSDPLLSIAVPVAALLFGIAVATVLARSSRRILDRAEVVELLGIPFAATVPSERALRHGSILQLKRLPDEYRAVVNVLCVQAEAQGGTLDSRLTVLVTGSRRVSGTTTLAAAMASRFGELGLTVALIDLDFDRPDLSTYLAVPGDGLSALVNGELLDGDPSDGQFHESPGFSPTPWPNVAVVGRQPGIGQVRPQRAELLAALDTAVDRADVVVLDAGPMLAASAAALLAQQTDVVVLAVPVRGQARGPLKIVARQLVSVMPHVLPVAMPQLKRGARRTTPAIPSQDIATHEVEVASPTAG